MSGGMMLASITAWIWLGEPAVMLLMVQHASFLMPSLGEESSASSGCRAPLATITCVCMSSPVTMLPTERSAGVCTAVDGCISRSTSRRHTPDSITAWIFSFAPSERYEIAQQASIKISSSIA